MKKLFLFIFLLCVPFLGKADALEDLTKEQAESLKAYLMANPVIIDYCDCCKDDVAVLFRLLTAQIEPSELDPSMFVVKYYGNAIYNINYSGSTPTKVVVQAENVPVSGVININYMFGHIGKGKAKPLGHIIGMAETPSCIKDINYPTDAQSPTSVLPEFDYKFWYTKHTKGAPMNTVMDFYRLLDDNSYAFTKSGDKWLATSYLDSEVQVEATVDIPNGFMQYGEEGFSIELAIFKLESGKYLVGEVVESFDGVFIESSIRFLQYDSYWKDVTAQVFPAIKIESFMKQGYKMFTDPIETPPAVVYTLPKTGTTVLATLAYEGMKYSCEEGGVKIACDFIKQIQYKTFEVAFSKAGNGSFSIKAKK